ncbi:mucin TcMUCII [Trypanosoma cruzi]|nr:mucin TcMUCII [Trypanosoma cruzi]
MPSSMHGNAATSIPLPRDAVINGLLRVCDIIGTPHNDIRAPLAQHRIFPWDTVSCNKVEFISHALPKTPLTTSSARLFILLTPLWGIVILIVDGRSFISRCTRIWIRCAIVRLHHDK